jgi:dephospho-CoA kinase
MIRAEVNAAVHAAHAPYVVIVVPLLIETGAYRDLAQRILVVDCSEQQQVARVIQRNGFTAEAAHAIMATQASRAERLGHADDVVHNETGLGALRAGVVALHRRYLDLAKAGSRPG